VPVLGQLVQGARILIKYEEGFYVQKTGAKNRQRSTKQRKGTKIDLTAFYSVKNKDPTKEKHDKMIISPQGVININTKINTEKFEADCDCIYFSFYSVSGCTVWLQAMF
jgi:hypothetical protein